MDWDARVVSQRVVPIVALIADAVHVTLSDAHGVDKID